MAPLEVLEPAGPTRCAQASLREGDGGRPLNVEISFLKGNAQRGLSLRVRLPRTWDSHPVSHAVVAPFVEAYDERHPDATASQHGPFTHVRVLVWAGPQRSAADKFRGKGRDGEEDFEEAERPVHCLLDANEPVSVLRSRCHNRLKPAIVVELVKAESTALVVRSVPSTSLLVPGEQLLAMLQDGGMDTEDMHALVDAAIAGGALAYLGLTTARDRRGRNCLHLAATRGDATLCRKLLHRREDLFAMDSNRDTALHIACLAGRQVRPCTRCCCACRAALEGRDHTSAMRPARSSCLTSPPCH